MTLVAAIMMIATAGCVHEFPEDEQSVPFYLTLDFSDALEMGFYQTVDYTTNRSDGSHDLRYIVKAYRIDGASRGERMADYTFTFTKSDLSDYNYTARLNLVPGEYRFLVWTDFVDHGSQSNLYYTADDFEEIILADKARYTGCTDWRDCFRGEQTATVWANTEYTSNTTGQTVENRATVMMERPLGKFKVISKDVVKFLQYVYEHRLAQAQADADAAAVPVEAPSRIEPGEYTVKFYYQGFMPCSFNMFTNRPADAWTGVTFDGAMLQIDNAEVQLGFDYVFVNGHESTVTIVIEVYDRDNSLLSRTNPVDVPLVRNKLTIVEGNFLTVHAAGGVAIDPAFDGEYNYRYN